VGPMIDITLYNNITLNDIIIFFIILAISLITARILRSYTRKTLKDKIAEHRLKILEKFVYYAIIIVGIIIVLPQFGIDLTGLLVAGGFIGFIIGFASQSVVSNFVSGLFLIIERPIKIGDQICVEDISGVVKDIRILSTIVRTYEGFYVRIPNERVFSSKITNFVANAARRFDYTIGISYADDADKAIQIIKDVIDSHPFTLKNPPPNIAVENLGESSVDIAVRAWTPSLVWYDVKCELLWKIKVELQKNGITIPFPQRVIHITGRNPLAEKNFKNTEYKGDHELSQSNESSP
jgi:small-conductance mechanosensitive channel